MKNIDLGPFVVLFAVDKKQQTFFESWKNLKIKPHWCYLSYNQTDQWVMKFARITSNALSSTQIIIPDEKSPELIVRRGHLVPKTLQVMLLSSLHSVESFDSCVLGLDDDGQLHAYTRNSEKENIVHTWSYNLNAETSLTKSLPPFYEKFGIRASDFNAINDAFNLKNRNTMSEKFKNYRDKLVTTVDKEMLDSLNLIYGYEMAISTESFNKYRENFSTLTEEDATHLSRLYFSGKVEYFHILIESRSSRSEIDLLINKILNHESLYSKEEVNDARKKLWTQVEKSPIDVAYLQYELSNSPIKKGVRIDSDIWIDFVVEISSKNVRLLCYYSDEAVRLYDLHRFLLPLAEKYPEKLQECLDQFTDMEFIHMVQAYADFFRNPPTVHYPYFESPTFYIKSIFEYMTVKRMSQLIEEVQTISEKNSHWEELYHFFEEAMQTVVDKSPHLMQGATNYQSL